MSAFLNVVSQHKWLSLGIVLIVLFVIVPVVLYAVLSGH